ncbi:MAG: RidA family protein [Gammaproteobacteria bacterium]|nr:RidA family protein [Gammaproteobacteria bacterium]
MTIQTVSTGGRFEAIGAYSRAKRIGPFIYVAGTTAIEPSGKLHAPNDTYAQSMYIFDRIRDVLLELGAEMKHVVRTRAFMTNMKTAGEFVRAHGEVFQGINPVTSGVEAGLTTPGMMIEIEVDAVIHDESGTIEF